MKLTISVVMASVAALGVSVPAYGQEADRSESEISLAVTPNQTRADRGGYVLDGDGSKTFVNALCKKELVDAGAPLLVSTWRDLKSAPTVRRADRLSCDELVAAILDDPGQANEPDPAPYDEGETTEGAVLHETLGTSRSTDGGLVVVDSQTWTSVSNTCKAALVGAGVPTVSSRWSTVTEHDRQQISCQDVLTALVPDGESDVGPVGDDDPVADDPVGHDPVGHDDDPSDLGGWVRASVEAAEYSDGQVGETYRLFDPDNHPDPTWGRSRIGWLVECDSVKFEQVDPIVAPGPNQASSHLHEFFGNPNVSSTSTTQSFADTPSGDIECTDVNDKSAYWSPAVFQDGKRVTADKFKAYYKSTTANTVPMPFGLRMIAGDANSTGDQGELVGWFEVQRTSDLTPREDLTNTLGSGVMITRPNGENNIVLRMNFPNCWDGVHLDSPDHQSHVAYFDEASQTCPSTHPVKIPQLTTFAQYDVDGGAGFSLASGPWHTYHQDFWNAWSPDQMAELNDRCILDELNCRVRSSNALIRLGQYSAAIPAS